MWGAYFCMGAYERDVVAVIKWVPIFMGCLFSMGAYYHDFTVYQFIPIHLLVLNRIIARG